MTSPAFVASSVPAATAGAASINSVASMPDAAAGLAALLRWRLPWQEQRQLSVWAHEHRRRHESQLPPVTLIARHWQHCSRLGLCVHVRCQGSLCGMAGAMPLILVWEA